jgi:hypothetical protein
MRLDVGAFELARILGERGHGHDFWARPSKLERDCQDVSGLRYRAIASTVAVRPPPGCSVSGGGEIGFFATRIHDWRKPAVFAVLQRRTGRTTGAAMWRVPARRD